MRVNIGVLHATLKMFISSMFRPVRNKNSTGHISLLIATFILTGLLNSFVCVSSNYDTSMVERLLGDRDTLIQDGLSYFNGTTLRDVKR